MKWLPPLVLRSDFDTEEEYIEHIYVLFCNDFVGVKFEFLGLPVHLKRHPYIEGKEATFWHMTTYGIEDETEQERTIDHKRCERINWPKALIQNHNQKEVLIWKSFRRRKEFITIYLQQEEYVFIIALRQGFVLPWTAYLVKYPHKRRSLLKEYLDFKKSKGRMP